MIQIKMLSCTHISMFTAVLFTMAKTWKPHKCTLTEGRVKKMWYIHDGILLSHEENKIMPFPAIWMQLDIIILSEVSQKEKDKYHVVSLTCGI